MKKEQLFDLIQRVSSLSGISAPIIVGSHSLFAVTDNVPAIVLKSIEAELIQQTASEGALLPRLQKLFDYLRKQQTITDLRPLSELINRLS